MSVWLTDAPSAVAFLVGGNVDWTLRHPGENEAVDALAEAFNPGRSTWVYLSPAVNHVPDVPLVLIDTAERSQFDAMLDCTKTVGVMPDNVVCLALTGTNFRGQRARPWTALRGNLHLTVRYRLRGVGVECQPSITMIPAVAAAQTIQACSSGGLDPKIKWVNDVFVHGRKVSGVLTSTHVTGATVEQVVFGIGMNIDQTPEIEPTPFVPAAGHLAGFEPLLAGALPIIFHRLIKELDELVGDLQSGRTDDIFERYRGFAGFIGERVCLWPEGTESWKQQPPMHRGRVVDLHADLSLVLEHKTDPVRSGRMAYESVWANFQTVADS